MRAWWILLRRVPSLKYADDSGEEKARGAWLFAFRASRTSESHFYYLIQSGARTAPQTQLHQKKKNVRLPLSSSRVARAAAARGVQPSVYVFNKNEFTHGAELSGDEPKSLLSRFAADSGEFRLRLLRFLRFSLRNASASASVCFTRCATLSAASLCRVAPRCLDRWWSGQINLHHPIDHINSSNPLFAKQIENNFVSLLFIVCYDCLRSNCGSLVC